MSKSKTYLWHPLKGKVAFSNEHATNLLKLEKKHPSGWVAYDQQDGKDESTNNQQDAANDRGNKRNPRKKPVKKSVSDSTGDSTGE